MANQNKDIQSIKADEKIVRKIYLIREQKVMLDFDLANLYEVEIRSLNQAVKRNFDRFPEDSMFRLLAKEWKEMIPQFVSASEYKTNFQDSKQNRSQNSTVSQTKRKTSLLPLAFTERGVTMIASILKSERAIKMSIAVVRAFIEFKKAAVQYSEIIERIQLLKKHPGAHDVQLNVIFEARENLMDDKAGKELATTHWNNRKKIGFKSED